MMQHGAGFIIPVLLGKKAAYSNLLHRSKIEYSHYEIV